MRNSIPYALALTVLITFASFAVLHDGQSIRIDQVKVEGGLISGSTCSDPSVKVFKGIPFAAPPVGALRWKAPEKVIPWKGVRSCTKNPPSAMQAKPSPFYCWSKEFLAPEEPISEDCLYLNVWSSARTRGEKRPVIVWIHGGAFTGGSGTVPLYDGEEMAKKGVVFVTINYRLGIFGFLALSELSSESASNVSGNYGILDQIAALKWVKKNIDVFGGDPENVTIAGQSAGAMSVAILMASPLSKGLFQKAIGQSGAMFGGKGMRADLHTAEKNGRALFELTGAKSLEELRRLPAEKIQTVNLRTGPILDDYVVMPADSIFRTGAEADVPLLTGWNADDGVSFGPPQSSEKYLQEVEKRYGENVTEFLRLFPGDLDSQAASSQKLLSSISFGWQNVHWARMQSHTGHQAVFLYYFTHVPPGQPDYGAFHSAEFGYALNTLKYWDRPFTANDYKLADIMSSYWIQFAATGNPNSTELPNWPAYSTSSEAMIILGDEVKAGSLPFKEQFDFIEKINNQPLN